MKKNIQDKLSEIEKNHTIKILFAIESGSRAWGFPSIDSDYDVRFIYVRPLDEYLKINSKEDFIEFPINDELDFYGWDLKKFFKLLYASNASPFEWMQSPIFYSSETEFFEQIKECLPLYFCQQTTIHHYLGLTKKKLSVVQKEKVKVKSLFYILRSLLSAQFSLEKKEYPPIKLNQLLFLIKDEVILQEIDRLRLLKREKSESFVTSISSDLFTYLFNLYEELSKADKVKSKGSFDLNFLNTIYLKLINDANDRFFEKK